MAGTKLHLRIIRGCGNYFHGASFNTASRTERNKFLFPFEIINAGRAFAFQKPATRCTDAGKADVAKSVRSIKYNNRQGFSWLNELEYVT